MYQRYFGFKERPFRLVPDPAYLFMGGSHREAMAHLSYAVGSGDGFAMVIGEVGTGKTTLCRSFLERLEATVTSAYIFNPPADPVDLIRAVNRDFDLPVATDNLQDLVEDLNRFLIREKTAGRTVILVIDEAQRLSRQVLEQIRLLSNLETTRSKLLLIVLVGQPELQATLADPGLRQLRQRITARCRLAPLTLAETGAYIRHRLTVAADGPPVAFTPGAIRALFGFSGGIPRLINMACDRALLVAYAASDRLISRTVAVDAVRELSQDAPARRPVFGVRGLQTLVLAGVLVLALVVLGLDMAAPPQGDAPILPVVARRPGPKTPKVQPPPRTSVESALPRMWLMDRSKALDTVLSLWGCSAEPLDEAPDDDLAFFRRRVAPTGLAVYRIDDRPDLVDRLNLPALLVINDANGSGYAVLAALKDGQYLLRDGTAAETAHPVSGRVLNGLWSKTAYVLWKDFYAMAGDIPGQASGETVLNLKRLLRPLGYDHLGLDPVFDGPTRRAVIDFQTRHGLPADGVVGSMTKIALYNTRPELAIPKLQAQTPAGGREEEAP